MNRKTLQKLIVSLLAMAVFGVQSAAHAQAKERFVPAMFYWVGPYAAGGSGIAGGLLDDLEMLNRRDGGINGVKFTDWMAPMPEDRKLVRQKYLDSARQYAKEKGISPRQCSD